jgi:peptide/nickel transport system substrate-binding protein
MSNLKLRQALQMAVDWDGINHAILHDTGTPIRALMPPTVFGADRPQLQPAYDALPVPQSSRYDAAKALVAQAGPDAGRPVVMAVPALYTGQGQQFGNAVADAGRRIGLNFHLKVVPTAQYTNYLYDPKTRAGVDILSTDFWPNVPNALDWLGIAATTGGSFNQYGYHQIDAMYAQAQGTADPAARNALAARMMTTLRAELLPMVPGISRFSRLWMNNRITGAPASFAYVYFPWAAYLGGSQQQ